MEEIINNENLVIHYRKDDHCLVYNFIGQGKSELIINTCKLTMTNNISNVQAIIAVFSETKGSVSSLKDFFEKEYFPYLLKKGLLCCAFVVPYDIDIWASIDKLQKQLFFLESKLFTEYEKADIWIKSRLQ